MSVADSIIEWNITLKSLLCLLADCFCAVFDSMSKARFTNSDASDTSTMRKFFHLVFFIIIMLAYVAAKDRHRWSRIVDGHAE